MTLAWVRLVLLITLGTGVTACSASPAPDAASREVRVAAAADLRRVLDRIIPEIARRDGWQVSPTYGSSGNFFAQISNGAPFDLFLSADVAYAEKLVEAGRGRSLFRYGSGKLVALAPSRRADEWMARGLALLEDPDMRRIAIANPAHAPYGKAAVQAMESAGVYAGVRHKLVFGDNVGQALEFVASGSADAGLLALSLVPDSMGMEKIWEVPQALYPPIIQAGIIVGRARNPAGAEAVRSFILSPEGQAMLREFGFGGP